MFTIILVNAHTNIHSKEKEGLLAYNWRLGCVLYMHTSIFSSTAEPLLCVGSVRWANGKDRVCFTLSTLCSTTKGSRQSGVHLTGILKLKVFAPECLSYTLPDCE